MTTPISGHRKYTMEAGDQAIIGSADNAVVAVGPTDNRWILFPTQKPFFTGIRALARMSPRYSHLGGDGLYRPKVR